MKAIYSLTIVAIFLFSCEKNNSDLPPQGTKDLNLSEKTTGIIQSDNDFGLALFRKVISQDTESANVFISPTSVALALAMTYNGAAGETKTAMEIALKKQGFTVEEINSGYKSLIEALQSVDPKVLLEIANSIWYREGFNVLPQFISVNQDYYDAEVSSLDFDDAGAPGIINGWVNNKTHGKISEIVDEIPGEAVMFLINAIYFKGIWQYEFDEENTADGSFYLSNGSPVTVTLMKQTTALFHMAVETFSMVELPYGRGNFSMVVILPQPGYSTGDVISSLNPENWEAWRDKLEEKNVDLSIPKFTFEYKNELNDELDSMGMGVAFTGAADFSGINGLGELFISKVLHKTFVEVNEEGTEAAAVTSVEIFTTSFPEPRNTVFNVDRPFLFAIRETTTGAILFIGLVQNPLTKENG